MKKLARFFSLVLFSALVFFGQTFASSAQEGEELIMSDIRYAAVTISNAVALDFVDKSGFTVSLNVKNIFPEKRAYQVGIEFQGVSEENKGEIFVWRNLEEFNLEGAAEQPLSFMVSRPQYLSGKYQVTLGMNDRYGNVVAMVSLGEKEFSHAGRVSLKTCTLAGDGEVVRLLKADEPLGTCEVVWEGAEDGLARIVTKITSNRYGVPKIVGESNTITKSDTATLGNVVVSEPVEPGLYQLEIVPVATGGYPIGAPIKKTLIVEGKGGRIKGVERFEPGKIFVPKETVPVVAQLELYDTGKYEIFLELMSQGRVCAAPIRATLDGRINTYEGEFVVTADCAVPEVRVTLSSDGKQIDQLANGNSDMSMQASQDATVLMGIPQWVVWSGVGVLALLLIYALKKRRAYTRRVMMPILFLFFSVSIFLGFDTRHAEAGSVTSAISYYCVTSPCPDSTTVYYHFSTNKDTYSPGENIQITLVGQTDDYPQPNGGPYDPYVSIGINGGGWTGDQFPGASFTKAQMNGTVNFNRTAPNSAGPFSLSFSTGLPGYQSQTVHMPLTVAVASPAPTVTISNFSPSTINAGQSATISLSTTNATSCSGDGGSLWTGNLGGTNFSNMSTGPMSAGTYTQRVTCTGPGGSASSATAVLIVNAVSPASGALDIALPCIIANGSAGCYASLSWTSSNTSTVVLTDCGGTALYTGGTGRQTAPGIYVPYNSGCYQIRNGSASGPILDQKNVGSLCISGTSWDGSKCAFAGTMARFTTGYSCVIASGQQACDTTLVWTISNINGAVILSDCESDRGSITDNVIATITNNGPGSRDEVYVPYNSGCYRLRDAGPSGPVIDQIRVSSSCVPGTVYDPNVQPGGDRNYKGELIVIPGRCVPVASPGLPTVDITATGPVSLEPQTWWQKSLSWLVGEKAVAAGNATITTSQNANISWTSAGASSCSINGPALASNASSNPAGQSVSGAMLGIGVHTYTIRCNNANGSAQATATVTVSNGAICGNNILEGGEACDNGGANGTCPSTCNNSCTLNSCGPVNGICASTHNNCSAGTSSTPTSDSTTWYWYCNGIGAGATDDWCNEAKSACTPSFTATTESCASVAGAFGSGVPADQTFGIANYSVNSCTGGRTYTGGCSVPPLCQPTSNTWTGACSTYAGMYGIPAANTVGTANFVYDTCWGSTYTGGCSAVNCNTAVATFTIACSLVAGESGVPLNYTVGTATIDVLSCGGTRYRGGCSLPSGLPQYTIFAGFSLGGTISPQGYVRNIPQGSSRTFVITPDAGYVIASVTIDGINQGSVNSVTINNIQNNHIIRAAFIAAPIGPDGQIGSVTPCTIPAGGSTCTSQISWTTSGLIPLTNNPALQVAGGTPFSVTGMTGTNESFTVGAGSHAVTLQDLNTGVIYDTDTLVASCAAGTTWTGGICQAAPTVNLTVNGSSGPVSASPGDSLSIAWTVNGATGCTASGKWSGSKSATGGTESATASAPSGDYILTCINSAGVTTTRQVTINLACAASTGTWSACGPPCAGGDGTRSRTVTTAACVITTETEGCTTATCRDLNWKEVGQ